MATELGNKGFDIPPMLNPEWWKVHIAVLVSFVAMISTAFVPGTIGGVLSLLMVAVFMPTVLLSYIAYYKDAKLLSGRDDNWQPSWITWVAGGVLLTPILASTLYLLFRFFLIMLPKRA